MLSGVKLGALPESAISDADAVLMAWTRPTHRTERNMEQEQEVNDMVVVGPDDVVIMRAPKGINADAVTRTANMVRRFGLGGRVIVASHDWDVMIVKGAGES